MKARGLVVTEGLVTEPEYFDLLKQNLSRSAPVVDVRTVGVGKDPYQVLEKCLALSKAAIAKDKPYDWCCCVVDVDEHTTLDKCIVAANKLGIHVVVSNVKFEIWLLWHLLDKRGAQTGDQLDKLVDKNSITRKKHLAPGFPIGNYPQAVSIATRVDPELADCRMGPNPSSSMPFLIGLMT